MPNRWRTWFWCVPGSSPSSVSVPVVGRSSVVSILIVVVLPAPLGPRKAKISPRATSNEMSSTACTSPKVLVRLRTSIMLVDMAAHFYTKPFSFVKTGPVRPCRISRVTRRPAFWLLLALLSAAAAVTGFWYFPQAFSIVALDITMDREHALAAARAIAARDRLGPPGYRQAASFALDDEAQTFVELEGGGKEAFTQMLRDGLYAAYTWRVRHFTEGETNETTIQFTPDGQPYGFVERLKRWRPGAALDGAGGARASPRPAARERWHVDFTTFALVEQGQERRPGGRVDHTFTYERPSPTLNEGRYRLRLVVSGDRLTEVTPLRQDPGGVHAPLREHALGERGDRRRLGGRHGAALRRRRHRRRPVLHAAPARWVLWRPAVFWGVAVAFLQALASINEWPLMWMTYDTARAARRRSSRSRSRRSP